MNSKLTYFNFLRLWFLGAFISFLVQFLAPRWFAHLTNWTYSYGWQWEIALWNLFACFLIILILKTKSSHLANITTKACIFLSFLLVINHLLSLVNHFSIGNFLPMIMNLFAVVFGLCVLKVNENYGA